MMITNTLGSLILAVIICEPDQNTVLTFVFGVSIYIGGFMTGLEFQEKYGFKKDTQK